MNTTKSLSSIKNNVIENENLIRVVTQNTTLKVVNKISEYIDTIGCITVITEWDKKGG